MDQALQSQIRCVTKLAVPRTGNGEQSSTIFYLFPWSTLTGADHCPPKKGGGYSSFLVHVILQRVPGTPERTLTSDLPLRSDLETRC